LSGLGAPHWVPEARGAIMGLSFAAKKAHIARAALEAMAHQTSDLKHAFAADGADWAELRIDGGMVANDWMAQDLADMLNIDVERPAFIETTALGAAMLAGVGAGVYGSLEGAAVMRDHVKRFSPQMDPQTRDKRLNGWADALARVL
jgi:glycerol kinase